MGKILERKITDFSLGMTVDYREQDTRYCQLIKGFDAHTFKNKLVPTRSTEAGDTIPNTRKVENFLSLDVSGSPRLYSLGVVSGQGYAEIGYKTNMTDTSWSSPSNGQSSTGLKNDDFFIAYKTWIYGARAGTTLWRHDTVNDTWTDTWQSITYTTMAQGLVHSDDVLYIPYDNKIATFNGSTFAGTALTLTEDKVITSICSYGEYIAIAMRPKDYIGRSEVFLWDGTSTSYSERIDWGTGALSVIEEVDGVLVGISYVGGTSSNYKERVVFKYYAGNRVIKFNELENETTWSVGEFYKYKQKVDNNLYFMMSITINGTEQQGIWRIGRVRPELPLSLVFDTPPNNGTAIAAGATMHGFYLFNDIKFLNYQVSSTYVLDKTDDTDKHDISSIYETTILNENDPSQTKTLLGVTVMHEALTANTQVKLQYKKDEETSFTTIALYDGTQNSNLLQNELRFSALNADTDEDGTPDAKLPEYKEITFRIEVDGYASTAANLSAITGLKYKSEIKDDDKY